MLRGYYTSRRLEKEAEDEEEALANFRSFRQFCCWRGVDPATLIGFTRQISAFRHPFRPSLVTTNLSAWLDLSWPRRAVLAAVQLSWGSPKEAFSQRGRRCHP